MFRVTGLGGSGYAKYLQVDAAEAAYWEGKGAEYLELAGQEVAPADFEKLSLGVDPRTGEVLRTLVKVDKHDENGEVLSRGKTVYDCVAMAPKSVSILSLVDDRLTEAHKVSVDYLTASMEQLAQTRVRAGGANENRETGNLVWGRWEHSYSRALDIQRHTHLGVVNLTFDGVEDKWKALQAANFYRYGRELTEVYRYPMSLLTENLGYEIIDKPGRDRGWEIAGIDEKLLQKFSQRSAERDAAIDGFKQTHGRDPTTREVDVLVRHHRPDKMTEFDPVALRELQFSRMSEGEKKSLLLVRDRALDQSYTVDARTNRDRPENGFEWTRQEYERDRWRVMPAPLMVGDGKGSERTIKIDPELLRSAQNFAIRDRVLGEPANYVPPWDYSSGPHQSIGM